MVEGQSLVVLAWASTAQLALSGERCPSQWAIERQTGKDPHH